MFSEPIPGIAGGSRENGPLRSRLERDVGAPRQSNAGRLSGEIISRGPRHLPRARIPRLARPTQSSAACHANDNHRVARRNGIRARSETDAIPGKKLIFPQPYTGR